MAYNTKYMKNKYPEEIMEEIKVFKKYFNEQEKQKVAKQNFKILKSFTKN